jgi:hypothetical protein
MKIKVYIMHSEKTNFKEEIYKPLLEIGLMKDYLLILPLSERFKANYIKELINDCDIVICDLTKFNFLANIELKTAKTLNKEIIYFINKEDKNINKYKDINLNIYENKEDFSNKVKVILDSLNHKEIILKRDNIYSLGKINIG